MKTGLAVRSAVRAFRRRPGFFAIAVTSLGIALGLSTAVFAMIDSLRHPIAANEDVDRLVFISPRGRVDPQFRMTHQEMYELVGLSYFQELTIYGFASAYIESDQRSERAQVNYVPPNFFRVYGLHAARGRLFNDVDFGLDEFVVVKDEIWRRHFGNREELDGARLTVGERQYTVVGVLPPHAQGPDVLIARSENAIRSGSAYFSVVARLRTEHTIESLQPVLRAAEERYAKKHGFDASPLRFVLMSLRPEPLQLEGFHIAMLGGAFGILLIACANVAALMLSRGVSNRREYALHMALGAAGKDLTRNVVVEVALLGLAGAVVGLLLATWSTQVLIASLPEMLLNIGIPKPQWSLRVFGMVFLATSVAVAVAAIGPAWYAAHTNPNEPLKESAGTTTGRSRSRFQMLVVAEIAVSMVLLFGASLMAKSARLLANYDFGYNIETIVSAQVSFAPWRRGQQPIPRADRVRTVQATLDRVRTMPGIERAALSSSAQPDSGVVISDGSAQGEPVMLVDRKSWYYQVVGPEFFSVFGVHVVEGRDFAEGDRARGAVILSSGAARILFPRGSAVGRSIRLGDQRSSRPWLQVIGIVPNFKLGPRDTMSTEAPAPDVFVFSADSNAMYVSIVARTSGDPPRVVADMQNRLRDLTPPGSTVRTARWLDNFQASIRAAEYIGRLFAILGVAALVLAAAGLFSVLSYVVSQRMREFAVRMALGAQRLDVVRLVLRNAMTMALGGTAIGAGVGMWAGFLIWNLLYGVYPVDAEALIIAEVTLLVATLAACALPALRATRANPVDVMRAT